MHNNQLNPTQKNLYNSLKILYFISLIIEGASSLLLFKERNISGKKMNKILLIKMSV